MDRFLSLSAPLIKNSQDFLNIEKTTLLKSLKYIFSKVTFIGWGRKKSGIWATTISKLTNKNFLLLEDGFIRSFGLGVDGSPSFSMVKDDVGIYYDATTPSRLENIFNSYDFKSNKELMSLAKEARAKIIKFKISKYNNFKKVDLGYLDNDRKKVLIVAQTYGDSSLKYGLAERFTTKEMIDDAIRDNPDAKIYIKIHPDVLSGKKKSDINGEDIPKSCQILKDNANPIELMSYFDKIYTKTSGMGFEALLLGMEVHCYGMPFYAGWGVTEDKQRLGRRVKKLTIDELFAGGYILYTDYYNPYIKKKSDIVGIIEYINLKKRE
jgi:capsular polysaccharide export protein